MKMGETVLKIETESGQYVEIEVLYLPSFPNSVFLKSLYIRLIVEEGIHSEFSQILRIQRWEQGKSLIS